MKGVKENDSNIQFIIEIVRGRRKDLKMTQEELGKILGVQKAFISKFESGKRIPRVDTFLRICKALDLKVELIYPERIPLT